MYLRSNHKTLGAGNFHSAVGNKLIRGDLVQQALRQGLAPKKGLSAFVFKYDKSLEKPLAVGIIGTGTQGLRLLAAVNPAYIAVKSIADVRPSNVAKALDALKSVYKDKAWKTPDEVKKDVKVYDAFGKLIDAAKADGLEAVVIALPSHLHAAASLAAMKAGLHVLVETPMALSVADAKEMARTAKEKKLCLAVGQQRRYSLVYDNALEMVRKSLLEDVHYIRAQWHVPKPEKKAADKVAKKGDAKGPEKVDAPRIDWWRDVPDEDKAIKAADFNYDSLEQLVHWQFVEKLSGGLVLELGSQLFDASSMVLAASPNRDPARTFPLSVAGSGSQLSRNNRGDIDDHVHCVFEYTEKDYVDFGPPKSRKKIGMQFDFIFGNEFDGYGETVLGRKGSLVLENEQRGMLWHMSDTDKSIRVVKKEDKKKAKDAKDSKDVKDAKDGPVVPAIELPDDGKADAEAMALGELALHGIDAGYAAELEHWAVCCRKPSEENKPRGDAAAGLTTVVLAVAASKAIKLGTRIDFKKEWFDVESKETPDDLKT